MSETAPEAPPPAAGGSFLTRKYGPLPGWGWAVLGAALAGGYYLWRRNQSASPAATTAAASTSPDTAPDISAVQSEVQQLQGAASTDVTRDTAEAGKETKTAAQLAAEEKTDAAERKQLDTAQKRIAALQREERKEHPPRRRRSPAAKGGSGERRKK